MDMFFGVFTLTLKWLINFQNTDVLVMVLCSTSVGVNFNVVRCSVLSGSI